ncbi:MAG: catalase/peroxidase HPI [Pseudomonadota bacterium]
MGRPSQRPGEAKPNEFWWPERLNLTPLRQNEAQSSPYGPDFDYQAEFLTLDLDEVKADIEALMTTSQDWWPADYGHYGPFFIRMAWHSAGTYRTTDGRGGAAGGQQRFEPLNSWPDNANLDKARRLLWPVKAKYGHRLSWADLMVLTGNVALESMGFETYGFAGGREDDWQAELVYWGPETTMLGDERYPEEGSREPVGPLAAVQMGLIYVNPEGPGGNHNPLDSARDIRETFGRMAMNDEETVALIAGGHTFGKAHGARSASCVGAEPAANGVEDQGIGWNNTCGKGNAEDTVTSGLEGAWTSAPAVWTHQYLENLLEFEWVQEKSPAGAVQWVPANGEGDGMVPDAHLVGVTHAPIMLTSDLALKEDPAYREIIERFYEDPDEFELAFAKAWYKLTHRDMGPRANYLGSMVPDGELIWQDPIPAVDHPLIGRREIAELKQAVVDTNLTVSELVRTAWSSAASFRESDQRGGTNGGRLRLAPQRDWAVNNPDELARVLSTLEGVQQAFNDEQTDGTRVSMADLIVLAGAAAVEEAAADAGYNVTVPFTPGRTDASAEQTDASSFAVLEPRADGFRNFYGRTMLSPSQALVDKADLLDLTVPEMTILVGGLRSMDANVGGAKHGVLTDRPGTLSNDFFVNLLNMSTRWQPVDDGVFEGRDRNTGELVWTATEVDLVFGSNAELRSVVEAYAFAGSEEAFVDDFVDAWSKVMRLGLPS